MPGTPAKECPYLAGYYVLVYADTRDPQAERLGESLGHRGGALRDLIQDPANGLRRISILGTSVNRLVRCQGAPGCTSLVEPGRICMECRLGFTDEEKGRLTAAVKRRTAMDSLEGREHELDLIGARFDPQMMALNQTVFSSILTAPAGGVDL
jgi:hypothetical protein